MGSQRKPYLRIKATPENFAERIWSRIDKRSTDECWTWIGNLDAKGYGVTFGIVGWTQYEAHRQVYEMLVGPIPKGLCVLHSCDNPPCVNPNHLWLGTKAENNFDRHRKNRTGGLRGEAHPNAVLSSADVLAIRASVGSTQTELAAKFGVSQYAIWAILHGRSRRHG